MKLSSILHAGVVLAVFCVGWNLAQSVHPCDPYAQPDRLVGELAYSPYISDIEVVGDRIYVAANRIDVLELDAAGVPHVLDSWAIPATAIAAWEDLLFITTRVQPYELIIVRPTAPIQPEILSRTPINRGKIAVQDGIALIGGQVFDVSDPYQPEFLAQISAPNGETGFASRLELPYAHMVSYSFYLIMDLSDPAQPQLVGKIEVPYEMSSVDIQGGFAYVTVSSASLSDPVGLTIYDISDLTHPVRVGGQWMASEAITVLVDGNYGYVGCLDGMVAVFDLETPSRARFVEAQRLDGYSGAVIATKGNFLLVGASRFNSPGKFCVLDMSLPTWRPIESVDESKTLHESLASSDDFLLTTRWPRGGSIYRLVGESVHYVGELDIPEEVMDATIIGDRAFVAAGLAGVQIVSLADVDLGSIVGRLNTPGSANAIVVRDSYAYVGDSGGMLILDVQDPADPALVGSYLTAAEIVSLAVEGDRAFLALRYGGIQSIDISNPYSPSLLAVSDHSTSYDGNLLVSDGIAYFVSNSERRHYPKLSVFDVSDPSVSSYLNYQYMLGEQTDATILGDFLYASSSDHGVSIVDVSDPTSPLAVASYPVPYGANGIAVARDRLYFAGSGGLFSGPLHHDCRDVRIEAVRDTISPDGAGTLLGPVAGSDGRSLPLFLTPFPNPSRGDTAFSYRVPAVSRLNLAIYDGSGRIVRTLLAGGTASGGDGLVHWDGRDQAGKQAASGVYFVRIEAPGVELREKLVLIR